MAIDWSSGAGLFDKAGKLVSTTAKVDEAGSTDMLVKYNAFLAKLTETTDQAFLGAAIAIRDAMRTAIAQQNSAILNSTMQSLLNGEIIAQEALGADKSLAVLWPLVRYYMGRDAVALLENVPTIGGTYETIATPQSSPFTNTGDATIACTIKSPFKNITVSAGATVATDPTKAATHPDAQLYEGVLPDSYEFKVTKDKSNGAVAGNETISVEGSKLNVNAYDYDWKHAGSRGNITVNSSVSGSKLSNGGFETFSGGTGTPVFSSWTLSPGVTGTNLIASSSSKLRDTYSAVMTPTVGVSPKLSQTITGLKARTKYLVCIAAKKTASGVGAGATFTVQVVATGWTPHASEKISKTCVAGGTLATSWTRYYFWINTPDAIPATVTLEIQVNEGTGPGYATVEIDEALVIETTPFADGLTVVAVANATDLALNDRYTLAVTNAVPGLFQTFFCRFFGTAALLPSAVSGTTGIVSESLAS